jgi:hypothetical protein
VCSVGGVQSALQYIGLGLDTLWHINGIYMQQKSCWSKFEPLLALSLHMCTCPEQTIPSCSHGVLLLTCLRVLLPPACMSVCHLQVNLKPSSSSSSSSGSSGRRLLRSTSAPHHTRRLHQKISASQAEAEAVIAQSVENLYALGGVAPGGSMRYEWYVPDAAGPGSRDGPVVVYAYVSGVDHIKHINAGERGGEGPRGTLLGEGLQEAVLSMQHAMAEHPDPCKAVGWLTV